MIGYVEYATRHLLLNPKVIASNQVEDYFRVNSLFFDPNIYGRFLAIVLVLIVAWSLWRARTRDVALAGLVCALLFGGLVLTLSQSSFAALLAGLAVLGGLRWNPRRAALAALAGARARRGSVPGRHRPIQLVVGERRDQRALRADQGRRRAGRRRPDRRPGLGLVPARVPARRARLRRARHVGVAHDPDHGPRRAGHRRPRRLPRAAVVRAAAVAARRARRRGARRGRGRLRRARGPHAALRRVPRGSADLGAARRRDGARRDAAACARRAGAAFAAGAGGGLSSRRRELLVIALLAAGAVRRLGARPHLSELRRLLPPGLGARAPGRRQAVAGGLQGADPAPALSLLAALTGALAGSTPIACSC